MKFRTEVIVTPSEFTISHKDKITMIGSCFVENISTKLVHAGFQVNINPFGIVYNPVSAYIVIEEILQKKKYTETDLFFYQGLYHSFSHHGKFSGLNPESVIQNINTQIDSSYTFLLEGSYLFITFGTANVYYLSSTDSPVANCHKIPANKFYNQRLAPENIINSWNSLLKRLRQLNPAIKIIFTVSPIRHWKDGAHDNQVSKSILFVAIDRLMEANQDTYYFPSYELLMDDLRDYRFYTEDMLHPNSQAVDYIWSKFSDAYFAPHTKCLIKEWGSIQKAFYHKPFNHDSKEYQDFLEKAEHRKKVFLDKNPEIRSL